MASTGTYLNFDGNAEEAINLYVDVFSSEIMDITRHGDFVGGEGIPEDAKDLLMTDSQPETNELYDKLMDGGDKRTPQDMGVGYYAEGSDKFGINWMFYNTLEG